MTSRTPEPRLLIVSCTRTKDETPGELPARRRYRGRIFQALDEFEAVGLLHGIELLVLSARHGLLNPDTPIQWYDQQMTPTRAKQVRPAVVARLAAVAVGGGFAGSLLWLEPTYVAAIDTATLPPPVTIENRLTPAGTRSVRTWLTAAQQ